MKGARRFSLVDICCVIKNSDEALSPFLASAEGRFYTLHLKEDGKDSAILHIFRTFKEEWSVNGVGVWVHFITKSSQETFLSSSPFW